MKKSLLIITIILVLFSCNKGDGFLRYPVQLISTEYQSISYPKVYTKYGEITDRTIIEGYIKAWSGQYFYFNTDTVITYPPDAITFKTSDTAIFSSQPGDWGKRVVKKNGGYFYFYMKDTLQGFKRMDNLLNIITSKIGTVKPYYKDSCPVFMGTSCMYEWIYDAHIATGTMERLEFPLLTYKITRTSSGSSTGLARQHYNNVFDPSVLSLLQDGDTLAIQTAKMIYSRRN